MTRALRCLVAVLALVSGVLALAAPPAGAVPTGITFDRVTPRDANGAVIVGRVAANNPASSPTWHLKVDAYYDNSSSTERTVSSVTISYPGSAITSRTYQPHKFDSNGNTQLWNFPAHDEGRVLIHDGLLRDLPYPIPATVRFSITFSGDANPSVLNFNLAERFTSTPSQAFFFPAKQSDIGAGELFNYGTRHVHDSGGANSGEINPSGGEQRYGYDIGVVRWNGSGWTSTVVGAPANQTDRDNDDFLIWDTPLYAMGDGVVRSCYRGEVDHDPVSGFDGIAYEHLFGNHLIVQYGNDFVVIAHNKNGSIPLALCPNDGQNNDLNIPVSAGQFIGRVGNTGRSTNAHIHLHVYQEVGDGVPALFLNMRSRADETSIDNLGSAPSLGRHDRAELHRNSLFSPNPCGFAPPAPGSVEVAYHGISESCWQDVYNATVIHGYHPTYLDGYNVGSATYFNVIFRTGTSSSVYHGLTTTTFESTLAAQEAAGRRLHMVDTYVSGGVLRYAAIFQARTGPLWDEFHNLTEAQFNTKFSQLSSAGYEPVNVAITEVSGVLRYTGLFEQLSTTGWTLLTVPASSFATTVTNEANAGRSLTYVNGLKIGSTPYLTGVFLSPVGGTTGKTQQLTSAQYQTEYNTQTGAGRLTRAVTGYDNGAGSARFAAVWRGRIDTTIGAAPANPTTSTSAAFTFTANNPFATRFECALDGTIIISWSTCSSPKNYAGLATGSHVFRTRAYDREGVVDSSSDSHSWTIQAVCNGLVATINGSGVINGTAGNDVIVGSNGNDTINGQGGNDTICSLGGDDGIIESTGDDVVFAGDGNDTFQTSAVADGADTYYGGNGLDVVDHRLRTGALTVTIDNVADDGLAGELDNVRTDVEHLLGGAGADNFTGSAAANVLDGQGGKDTVQGGAGNDILRGATGNDRLYGGDGADSLDGQDGDDLVKGDGGNDSIIGGTGTDDLRGGDGDDAINSQDGVGGNDTVNGGGGTDTATTDPGDPVTLVP